MKSKRRFLFLLSIPTFPIALACFHAAEVGVRPIAFLVNIIGMIIGSILFCTLLHHERSLRQNIGACLAICLGLITLSLFFPGSENVHRWISLGLIHLNISMVLTPLVLYGIYEIQKTKPVIALLSSLILSGVHLLQPDAGQATAFAIGATYLPLSRKLPLWLRATGGLVPVIGAIFTWQRLDPLEPVLHVEQILNLIASSNHWGVFSLIFSTTLLILPFIGALRSKPESRILTGSLLAYFGAQMAVTQFGWFPVPVFGAGAAGVIGWYLLILPLHFHSNRGETTVAVPK